MNGYAEALSAFLDRSDMRQEDFAAQIQTFQPTLNRWVKGRRFPNAEKAREIDRVTGGAVPFELWQSIAMERLGVAA